MSHSNTDAGRIVVYTSCAWRHGSSREGLRGLLRQKWRLGVDYVDQSVKPRGSFQWDDQDLDIARLIKERVSSADIFIAFGAETPDDQMWVELELSFAERMGKPIIVIAPYQAAHTRSLPKGLEGRTVTEWSSDAVRRTIWNALSDDKRNAFFERLCDESHDVKEVRAAMFSRRVEGMLDAHGRSKSAPGAQRKLPALANEAIAQRHLTGRFLLGASELATARQVEARHAPRRLRRARMLTTISRSRLRESYARAVMRAARNARPTPAQRAGTVRRFVDAANGLMGQERYRRIIEAQKAAATAAQMNRERAAPAPSLGALAGFSRQSTELAQERIIRA